MLLRPLLAIVLSASILSPLSPVTAGGRGRTTTLTVPQTSGINVALASCGATASGSTTINSNYPASATINGDRKGLNWGAGGGWNDGTSGSYPDWLQVDFGSSRTISEIDVFTVQDSFSSPSEPTLTMTFTLFGITAFNVQYWDGAAWVSVSGGDVTGNNKVWRKFTFTPLATTKIRVNVTSALSSHSRITEVEAWTPSQPPAASITSPANGALFVAPADITINANASDSDGTISKVEFFQGSTKLDESTSSPYSFAWTGVSTGSYSLTAKATDNSGATTTSTAVGISVNAPAGTISGQVTRSDGTTAIAGATVKIYQGTNLVAAGTTNGSGNYTIGLPVAGTFNVEASAVGYSNQTNSGVVVTIGATVTVNIKLYVPINYIYDELGRLVGVVDSSGEAARYAYDSVGNLLSIQRYTSTANSVIEFSPNSGPIGSQVTIQGSGFSFNPAQLTVTFNGTTASIVSASSTSIVATVPAGATTGAIAVTSPLGTATSDTSFTVTASNGIPTITSFTPAIVAPGNSITITGTNFESTPLNNRVKVNVVDSVPSTVTSTNIGISVPVAGSGHVSVGTPLGKAISTDDLYVVQPPHSTSDVVSTQRTTIGTTTTVSVGTANKIALVLFDGTAGQRVSINITNGTMGGRISLYNPDGSLLLSNAVFSASTFIDTMTLPATGTYSALVDPDGTQTGSLSFKAIEAPDITGVLSVGNSLALSTSGMGQNIKATFSGTAGQRISANASTIQACTAYLLRPGGSNLLSPVTVPANMGGVFFDTTVLPVTGTYTLLVDLTGSATGSATLTFWQVPNDFSGTITQGGSAVTMSLGTPGQNGSLTFNGTVGEQMALTISGISINNYAANIKKPDGSVLVSIPIGAGFIEIAPLTSAGQYTLSVNPADANTGSITFSLADTPELTGTLALDGTSLPFTTTTAGQNVRGNFTGTSGQRVSFIVSSNLACQIYVVKPDGSNLATFSMPPNWGGIFLEPVTLPATGAYSLFVDVSGQSVGAVTLWAWNMPADASGSLTIGGSSVSVSLATPGQNGSYTFSGTSSQQVTVHITSNTINPVLVKLLKPDGSQLTSSQSGISSFNLSTQTLPTTGTYTIVIDPVGAATGSLSVSVTSP